MTLQETCDRYYETIYHRCLYHLNFNQESAEEVTQQVFLVLCEKWPLVQYHPNLPGWLHKTTSYKLKKAVEGNTPKVAIVSTDTEDFRETAETTDIYSELMCRQIEADMEKYTGEILSRLNESEKILLEYIRGNKTYAEIAELLEITEGAVSMRVVRLYRKVREIVQEIVDNVL